MTSTTTDTSIEARGELAADPDAHNLDDVARVRSLVARLEASQAWPSRVRETFTFHQLARVVAHAVETVPFYRTRFGRIGLSPSDAATPDGWTRIPPLRRRDVQDAGQTLWSTHGRLAEQDVRRAATTGSTGQPVVVGSTRLTRLYWRAFALRDHLWHQRRFTHKLAVIRHTTNPQARKPGGAELPDWGDVTRGIVRTGPAVLLSAATDVREQVEWLARHEPTYLLTYPSNAAAIAAHLRETRRTLPSLLELRTFGELLTPGARARCEQSFGVRVVDLYSAQEVGYLALQCPESNAYHVQRENVFVEILREDGSPCDPGETGRVVVTTLWNAATPLIRYDIGDFAELGESCPCGRTLPVLNRIVGRQRNMLTLPDGEQRWPAIGDAADLARLPPFRQFQLVQTSLDRITVRAVTPRSMTAEEESAAAAYLADALGHPFTFTFEYFEEIPRSAGGKFEDVVSFVSASTD